MAFEEGVRSISLAADASLAGYTGVPGLPGSANPNDGKAQYRFVKVTGEATVGLADADDGPCIGVCQSKPQVTGQAATIAIRGVVFVVAGDTVVAGDPICPEDTTARAIKWTTGKTLAGTALTGGADGELISVLLA
jgi:hypothetical protein